MYERYCWHNVSLLFQFTSLDYRLPNVGLSKLTSFFLPLFPFSPHSSTRDLSLVEQVAGNATGTILFVSTSVTTPKVPRVAGRVRASIALNGWVLEPVEGGTRVTYYLHVNVKTFVPAFAAVKYLVCNFLAPPPFRLHTTLPLYCKGSNV